YVIVGAFVIAAIVTPPDVISQLLLAIPMCLLYEFGIMLAKMVRKPAAPAVYEPPSEDEMDRELDRIEASERSDGK
ncbi:MAG: twin-arginine translocase subunit TatC, partial [Thauera sp.]|nr:twin-arginine translocase subunit TatC [Thauera sp.]